MTVSGCLGQPPIRTQPCQLLLRPETCYEQGPTSTTTCQPGFLGAAGPLWLNGELLTDSTGTGTFDLGTDTGAGGVYVANGVEVGTERFGAITHYQELTADEFVVYGAATDAEAQELLTEPQPARPIPASVEAEH